MVWCKIEQDTYYLQDIGQYRIVLSTLAKAPLYLQFISFLFLITDKYNVRITHTEEVLQFNCLSCVHKAFTYCSPLALCVRSLFTVHQRSPNSPLALSALTVCSECAHRSLIVQVRKQNILGTVCVFVISCNDEILRMCTHKRLCKLQSTCTRKLKLQLLFSLLPFYFNKFVNFS